ncbi:MULTISPECIES: sigma-70 family RNA polymerase sigma factor [unclassified Microbacterium]|uniref:sigma-70 family RNA polymerase sigma factor n=1 Tax=unclassified Microbacterium TaxID=2609290 RepID=UPI00301B62C3
MTTPRTTSPDAPQDRVANSLSEWSDDDLVVALREGDAAAYEQLWVRHVGAAALVARRWAPTQADDLVSEAFLTVYDQIRHQGKGPTSSFRGYLFAVIRNIAARWYREGSRLVYDPDADLVVEDEPLGALERADEYVMLLHAFQELPARWQRILWLTDVENADRPLIAGDLGIRPNAVSSLHRRARQGLRLHWLRQHVPADLREDPAHVAADLPHAILRGPLPLSPRMVQHLAACPRCRAVDGELRASYRDGRKAAASVGGLAALGVVLPAASAWWVAPVTITAAAGIGPLGVAVALGLLAAGIGAATLSTIQPPATPAAAVSESEVAPESSGLAGPPREIDPSPAPIAAPPSVPAQSSTGAATPEIPIRFDPNGTFGFPARPTPTAPAAPGTVLLPGTGPASPAAPAVASATPSSTYFAPVFSGVVSPGATVAMQVAENTYSAAPDAAGVWAFDLRSLQLPAGSHTATVWTVAEGVASQPTSMTFTIEEIVLDGFADENPSVTLRDGMGGGLPFMMTGAPSGSVCIESDTGQSAVVPLDAAGTASRVLRFYNYGIYVLRMSACDGTRFGPEIRRVVTVTTGLFDPYVLDDEMSWDISEF